MTLWRRALIALLFGLVFFFMISLLHAMFVLPRLVQSR